MGKFNLTAQLQLQYPQDARKVAQKLKREFGAIGVPVRVNFDSRGAKRASTAIGLVNTESKKAQSSIDELGNTLGIAARRFGAISIASGAFLSVTRAIKNSLSSAVDFERELNKITQVTGSTATGIQNISDEVSKLSTSLGVASSELVLATRTLAQAGLNAEAAAASLEVLAKTDVAPTFDSIQDTTEGAIAILQQFGREAQKTGQEALFLEQALSAVNAVSKNFAVESADIITAIRKTGGSFEAAGGSLNELIALFTSVRATTRESADTIAVAFRTIFTRLQRTETIDALRELGIQLQDAEGKFIGPLRAIEELSTKLSVLDTADFRFSQIVENLGGFRQIGKVIPLLQQFSITQEALNVAAESGNSLTADAAIAQDSLAIQIKKVREEFDALIRKFTESESFKSIASGALSIANAFIKVAEAIEPILPLLTTIGAIQIGRILKGAFSFGTRRELEYGGVVHKFAKGGLVPGYGNRDTVPAMLTPGEYVLNKKQVQKFIGGGIVDQDKVAALILEKDRAGETSSKATFTLSDSDFLNKSGDLRKDVTQSAYEKLKDRKYSLYRYGIDETGEKTGMASKIQRAFVKGIGNTVESVSKGISGKFNVPPIEPAITDRIAASVTNDTVGTLFESLIAGVGKSNVQYLGNSDRPFDFVGPIGNSSKLFARHTDTFGYSDARATYNAANIAAFKKKIIGQASKENIGGGSGAQQVSSVIGDLFSKVKGRIIQGQGDFNKLAIDLGLPKQTKTPFAKRISLLKQKGLLEGVHYKVGSALVSGNQVQTIEFFDKIKSAELASGGRVPTTDFFNKEYQGKTTLLKKIAANKRWQDFDDLFLNYNVKSIDPSKSKDQKLRNEYLDAKIFGEGLKAGTAFEQIVARREGLQLVGGNDFLDFKYGEAKSDANFGKKIGTRTQSHLSLLAKTLNSRNEYLKDFTYKKDTVTPSKATITLYIDALRNIKNKNQLIEIFNPTKKGKRKRFATGGEVPAMVMPGEYIFSKKEAQNIGYGNLNRVNKFAAGGLVPGSGNRDTVPVSLEPGQFVLRKSATKKVMQFANGGLVGVQKFATGGKKTLDLTDQSLFNPKDAALIRNLTTNYADVLRDVIKNFQGLGVEKTADALKVFSRSMIKSGGDLEAAIQAVQSTTGQQLQFGRGTAFIRASQDVPNAQLTRGQGLVPQVAGIFRGAFNGQSVGDASAQALDGLYNIGLSIKEANDFMDKYLEAIKKNTATEGLIAQTLDEVLETREEQVTKAKSPRRQRGTLNKLGVRFRDRRSRAQAQNLESVISGSGVTSNLDKFSTGLLFAGGTVGSLVTQMGIFEEATGDAVAQAITLTTTFAGLGGSIVSSFEGRLKLLDQAIVGKGGNVGKFIGKLGGTFNILSTAVAGVAAALGTTQFFVGKLTASAEKYTKSFEEQIKNIKESGSGDLIRLTSDLKSSYEATIKAQNVGVAGGLAGVGGALGGAAVGAAIGTSFAPLIGTIVGGIAGAVIGSVTASGFTEISDEMTRALESASRAQYIAAKSTYEFSDAMKQAKEDIEDPIKLLAITGQEASKLTTAFQAVEANALRSQASIQGTVKQTSAVGSLFGYGKLSEEQQKLIDQQSDVIRQTRDQLDNASKELKTAIIAGSTSFIAERRNQGGGALDVQTLLSESGIDQQLVTLRRLLVNLDLPFEDIRSQLFNLDSSLRKQIESYNASYNQQQALITAKQAEIDLTLRVNASLNALVNTSRTLEKSQVNIGRTLANLSGTASSDLIEFGSLFSDISNIGDFNEFSRVTRTLAGNLGQAGGQIAGELISSAESIERLRTGLTVESLRLVAQSNSGSSLSDPAGVSAINDLLRQVLGPALFDGLNRDVRKALVSQIQGIGGIGEIDEGAIESVIKTFTDDSSKLAGILQQLAEVSSKYIDQYSQVSQSIVESIRQELTARQELITIQERGLDRLSDAFKGRLTEGQINANINRAEAFRTQRANIALTGTGARAGDINSLVNSLNSLRERQEINSQAIQNAIDPRVIARLQSQQARLADQTTVVVQELERLANQSERASDVLGQIEKERAKADLAAGKLEEFITGTAESRRSTLSAFQGANVVAATGSFQSLPEDLRSVVNDLLKQIEAVEPRGIASQVRRGAIFQDAIRGGLDARTAEKLAFQSPTSREDRLINELQSLNRAEVAAQNALINAQSKNTGTLEKLLVKLDGLLNSIEQDIKSRQDRQNEIIAQREENRKADQEKLKAEQQSRQKQEEQNVQAESRFGEKLRADIEKDSIARAQDVAAAVAEGVLNPFADRWDKITSDFERIVSKQAEQDTTDFPYPKFGGYNKGGRVGSTMYRSGGGDTVPAMLTPGEYVIQKSSVDKYGEGLLSQINSGSYFARGGQATFPLSAMRDLQKRFVELDRLSYSLPPGDTVKRIDQLIKYTKGTYGTYDDVRLSMFLRGLETQKQRYQNFADRNVEVSNPIALRAQRIREGRDRDNRKGADGLSDRGRALQARRATIAANREKRLEGNADSNRINEFYGEADYGYQAPQIANRFIPEFIKSGVSAGAEKLGSALANTISGSGVEQQKFDPYSLSANKSQGFSLSDSGANRPRNEYFTPERQKQITENTPFYNDARNEGLFENNLYEELRKRTKARLGYKQDGGSIFTPKGTDTVPAMLTPGEYVVRKSAVDKYGQRFMEQVNQGTLKMNKGGIVYKQDGGTIGAGAAAGNINIQEAITQLSQSINNSLQNISRVFDGFTQNFNNLQMTHEVNINGQLAIAGLNIPEISEMLKNSLGTFIGERIKQEFNTRNNQLKAG